jgi:hypothetical protein
MLSKFANHEMKSWSFVSFTKTARSAQSQERAGFSIETKHPSTMQICKILMAELYNWFARSTLILSAPVR